MGRYVQKRLGHLAGGNVHPALAHGPGEPYVLTQRREVQHVAHAEQPCLKIDLTDPGGPVDVLELLQAGVGRAVRPHQAVHAEVAVVGLLTEITAVEIPPGAVRCAAHVHGVVAPLPNEAAAVAVVTLEALEIVLQIPGAVAHGMRILAQHVGLVHPMLVEVAVDLLDRGIHAAVQVQVVVVDLLAGGREGSSLVMGQAGAVILLGPAQGLVQVRTHTGFVAHGPNHDAGAVLVPDDAVLHPVQYRLAELHVLGDEVIVGLVVFPVLEHHAVALQVSLADQVEAVVVAHAGEQRRVGIVAGADGVDVVLFHQHQVSQHMVFVHRRAHHRVAVVAVDAPELHLLAVDVHHLVGYVDLPHAHEFNDVLAGIAQLQCIQARVFRVPQLDIVQVDVEPALVGATTGHRVTLGIVQAVVDRVLLRRFAPQLQIHMHVRRAQIRTEDGAHKVVPNVPGLPAQQVHVTEDAGGAELVLVLQVRAVAPLQHQHRDHIITGMHQAGDIEFAGGVGYLAVAHKAPVDPHVEAGIHTLEHQRAGAGHILHPEVAHVQPAGVLRRHIGRIEGNRIAHVGVLIAVVAVHLPHRGHRDGLHRLVLRQEILRQVRHAFKIAEAPPTVQRGEAVRFGTDVPARHIALGIGHIVGAVGQGVDVQRVQVLMVARQLHGRQSFLSWSLNSAIATLAA